MPLYLRHCSGISIHALFAEGDLAELTGKSERELISIHALFAEGDA